MGPPSNLVGLAGHDSFFSYAGIIAGHARKVRRRETARPPRQECRLGCWVRRKTSWLRRGCTILPDALATEHRAALTWHNSMLQPSSTMVGIRPQPQKQVSVVFVQVRASAAGVLGLLGRSRAAGVHQRQHRQRSGDHLAAWQEAASLANAGVFVSEDARHSHTEICELSPAAQRMSRRQSGHPLKSCKGRLPSMSMALQGAGHVAGTAAF